MSKTNLILQSVATSVRKYIKLKYYIPEPSDEPNVYVSVNLYAYVDGKLIDTGTVSVSYNKSYSDTNYFLMNIPYDKMVKLKIVTPYMGTSREDVVYLYQHEDSYISNAPVAGRLSGSTSSTSGYPPETSIGFSWSEFTKTYQSSYEYSFEEEGTTHPTWVKWESGDSFEGFKHYIITGLKPETVYTFRIRAKDVRGYYSDTLSCTVQTDSDQVTIGFNQYGKIKKTKLYVNVDGKIRNVKKIYKNVDGKIKAIKSL